jgi:hypothetical protein
MTVPRNVFARDPPGWLRGRRTHDADYTLLSAVPVGKVLALGRVWEENLEPRLDFFIEQVTALTTAFTPRNRLRAEQAGATLDPRLVWAGEEATNLLRSFAAANAASRPDAGDWQVDLSEIFRELEAFRAAVGSKPDMNNTAAFQNALLELRAATDAVKTRASAAGATADGSSFLARSRDATRQALSEIRAAAARQWSQPAEPVRDSQTGMRDQLAAANRATDMRAKVAALNEANRAFWSARTRDHLDALLPRSGA